MATPKEDTWAFQPIGAPFPDSPMRVKGQQNMYVALWYKHGKPVCGRAWNNGGVVECSFPYTGRELTGQKDLGGEIQILQYKGEAFTAFPEYRFWYQWVPYGQHTQPHFQLVRCGQSTPILLKSKSGGELLGNLDMTTERAGVSWGGKEEAYEGGALKGSWVIVRNLKQPPPPSEAPKIVDDTWVDLKERDAFPQETVAALDRPLRMEDGTTVNHFVALWYKHGEPVFGRCWNQNGRLAASFSWSGKEFSGDVGSMQVLVYPAARAGFQYSWQPYSVAFARAAGWRPVTVGDVAPCVVTTPQGYERLGKVFMKEEKAGVPWAGKEDVYQGPVVRNFHVLCRNN